MAVAPQFTPSPGSPYIPPPIPMPIPGIAPIAIGLLIPIAIPICYLYMFYMSAYINYSCLFACLDYRTMINMRIKMQQQILAAPMMIFFSFPILLL